MTAHVGLCQIALSGKLKYRVSGMPGLQSSRLQSCWRVNAIECEDAIVAMHVGRGVKTYTAFEKAQDIS